MSPVTVYPSAFHEVSDAVKLAQIDGKELAITSGAYHNTSLCTITQNGVVINLSNLNHVRIDSVERLAYVQGGARFNEVEAEAIKHGLAMPGGTVSDIGVGGLTVGGGFGWLSGEHGLVIDNLLSAQVVVGDGRILTANATENADLFWGIRGGGSNFGIVVEFVFHLHEQRAEVFTTSLIYPADVLSLLVQQVNRWTKKQARNEAGSLIMFNDELTGKPMLEWFGFKNADYTAGKAAFKGFAELGAVQTKSEMVPYEKLNTLMNKYVVSGNRLHVGTSLERLDLKPFKKAAEAFSALDGTARKSYIVFEFYHHDKVSSIDIQETAFAQRAPVYNNLVAIQADDAAFDTKAAARSIVNKIAASTSTVDAANELGYANYADVAASEGTQATKAVFGVNYERMREVKKMYDPKNVFNKWFAVAPAI